MKFAFLLVLALSDALKLQKFTGLNKGNGGSARRFSSL